MKCKHCGHEIQPGDIFCPGCSALAPTKRENKIGRLVSIVKGKNILSVFCITQILLSVIFIILSFTKCFTIGGQLSLSLSETFAGGSKMSFVLMLIFVIASDAILVCFMLKKPTIPHLLLLVPAGAYIWGFVQFLIRIARVKKAATSNAIDYAIAFSGRLFPIVCVLSVILLALIFVCLRKSDD